MLSDYDVIRIANAVVERLAKGGALSPIGGRPTRFVNTTEASRLLGCSRRTVCLHAEQLGGIRKNTGRWVFEEEDLKKRYKDIINS